MRSFAAPSSTLRLVRPAAVAASRRKAHFCGFERDTSVPRGQQQHVS